MTLGIICLCAAFFIIWTFGALLSLKLEAIECKWPTSYRDLWFVWPVWPFFVVIMLTTKHNCSTHIYNVNDEWNY